MDNPNYIEWLRQGVGFWNEKRRQYVFWPNFDGINLRAELAHISLEGANLQGGYFRQANLSGLNLEGADLENAQLQGAYLRNTDLRNANLVSANFTEADLSEADLRNANLTRADLTRADLLWARVEDADFRYAELTGVDIAETQPWTSILYPDLTDMETYAYDFSEEIESIGGLVERCQLFEKHYEDNSTGSYFSEGFRFYFRGESDDSWELRPSVMRSLRERGFIFRYKEGEMLLDLMSQRPGDFLGVTSTLSQWVIAQQHGLKTRLLDITRNPLVALFHACEHSSTPENSDNVGILHIFVVPKCLVKTFDSDAISIVANLAKLPRFEQDVLMGKLVDPDEFARRKTLGHANNYLHIIDRLYHYIGQEKPYFEKRIDLRDFFRVFVVEPQQSFQRIRMQSGAFLISAFHDRFEREEVLASNENIQAYHHYKLTVPDRNKEDILQELKFLNVTREVLFPSLDEAAKAVVERYKEHNS